MSHDPELCLRVARVAGKKAHINDSMCWLIHDNGWHFKTYTPDISWSDAGPLVDRFNLTILAPTIQGSSWLVIRSDKSGVFRSDNVLVAICNAVAAMGEA